MEQILATAQIEPKKFRLLFGGLLLGGLLFIWMACLAGITLVEKSAEEGMRQRIEADALVLEDHVARALDTVSARLKAVATFADPEAIRRGRLDSSALRNLVFEDSVVRSLSLVDERGQVVLSSSPRNHGSVLPADALPVAGLQSGPGEVRFGRVLPYRDLFEAGRGELSEGMHLWLASMAVGDGRYRWVIAVNTSLFENLWARLITDRALGVGLVDYQGQSIVSHAAKGGMNKALVSHVLGKVQEQEKGLLPPTAPVQQWVAYRANPYQPVVLVVTADPAQMSAQLSGERRPFFLGAVLASILLLALLAYVSHWYLRYEASAMEMANQHKAISAHLMVSESSPEGDIIRANSAFEKVTGYRQEEYIGRNHSMFNSGFHSPEFYKELWRTVTAGKIWRGTIRNRNKSGAYYWVSTTIVPYLDAWGNVSRYVALYSDVTDAMALSEQYENERRLREELSRINRTLLTEANTDALTGLANRRAFDSFAAQAMASTRRLGRPLSLLMLDIDYFKTINDNHGHVVGDEVLRELSRRWSALIRSSDMLARLGGEEFVIILHQTTEAQAARLADKLREVTAATPVVIPGATPPLEIPVRVSIGLVSAEHLVHLEIQDLLETADHALYEAKGGGRDQVVSKSLG